MIRFPDPPDAYSIDVAADQHLAPGARRPVYYLRVYYPNRFPEAENHLDTQMLLRLKGGERDGFIHYSRLIGVMIVGVVPPGWPVRVVAMPSHRSEVPRQDCPLRQLIGSVRGLVDLSGCLVRRTTVRKAARAWRGQRPDQEVHQASMEVPLDHSRYVRGHPILLLDDVVTTGASMVGASQVLLRAGAMSVTRFALTNTQTPIRRRNLAVVRPR